MVPSVPPSDDAELAHQAVVLVVQHVAVDDEFAGVVGEVAGDSDAFVQYLDAAIRRLLLKVSVACAGQASTSSTWRGPPFSLPRRSEKSCTT